jgi:hypothetical protein
MSILIDVEVSMHSFTSCRRYRWSSEIALGVKIPEAARVARIFSVVGYDSFSAEGLLQHMKQGGTCGSRQMHGEDDTWRGVDHAGRVF